MTERITALLVHHNSETLATKGALERQGMHDSSTPNRERKPSACWAG